MTTTSVPSLDDFKKGHRIYEQRESRDPMYKTASFLVEHFWGRPADIADSLGVLLLTWNQAFYRYGRFDFSILERCITANQRLLDQFRIRDIFTFETKDEKSIVTLFSEFLAALRISSGPKAGTQSPVAVAKALHLLAPAYFPLWDDKIARAYHCHYAHMPAAKYLEFMAKSKAFAESLDGWVIDGLSQKSLLKLIDEYNYAAYTQKWL